MKATRIAYSKNLTQSKFNRLTEIAKRLGDLRVEVWRKYGSISGLSYADDRQLRDEWLDAGRKFNLPGRMWKSTLSDVWSDLQAYKEAAKEKVRKSIHCNFKENDKRKELYTLVNYPRLKPMGLCLDSTAIRLSSL